MSKPEATPIDLSTMLGDGEELKVNNKIYITKPISLKDIDKFMNDNLSLGSQIFSMANVDAKLKIDKWLSNYCFDENNESVTLQKAMDLDWNIVDLKNFFKKLCDLSG